MSILSYPLLTAKRLHYIVVGVIFVILCVAIYYTGTHGRLVIKNAGDKDITIYTVGSNNENQPADKVRNGAFIKSADYMIKNDSDGYSRFAHATVKGWLQPTVVELEPIKSADLSRSAALTYENFFQSDNQTLISLTDLSGYASGYTEHKNGDAFGNAYTDISFPQPLRSVSVLKNGQIIGLNNQSTVQLYSFKTRSFADIATIASTVQNHDVEGEDTNASILTPVIKRSSDVTSEMAGLYRPNSLDFYIVNTASRQTNRFALSLKPTDNIVFDVTDKSFVYINTPIDTETTTNKARDEERNFTFKATMQTIKGEDETTINLGSAKNITDIALSSSGQYLAVIKDSHLWIYRVSDSSVVMADIFQPTTQLFWNKDNLYRLTVEQGLAVFNTKSQQLTPIKVSGYGDLSFSVATPLDSKVYLSAFNKHEDSELADGYVIDLAKNDTGTTEKLSKNLPYIGRGYDITYLDNTIYIRTKYVPTTANDPYTAQLKKQATDTLNSLFDSGTLTKSKVIYVN